jgi:formamidopyrimidine-DNA glycosylase
LTQISKLNVISGRYVKTPIVDSERLIDCVIERVFNHGKLIVFDLRTGTDHDLYIHSTLGMTGWWGENQSRYARFETDGTRKIVFNDLRNFGTIKIVDSTGNWAKLKQLGPDLGQISIDALPTIHAEIEKRLARYGKKQTIGEALLDQRIFCGIGNYLRADALYLSGLSPHRAATALQARELEALVNNCCIVTLASYENRSPIGLKRPYHHLAYGRRLSPTGQQIIGEQLNGRTIWWSPTEQR